MGATKSRLTEEGRKKLIESNKRRTGIPQKKHKKAVYSEEARKKLGWRKGLRWSEEHKRNLSIKHMGDKNPMWKGDKVGYSALHDWIKSRLPKPLSCENCLMISNLDLANISQEYKRDLTDWEWLCRFCHMKKDGRLIQLHDKEVYKRREMKKNANSKPRRRVNVHKKTTKSDAVQPTDLR